MSRLRILGLAALMGSAACGGHGLSPARDSSAPEPDARGGIPADSAATSVDTASTTSVSEAGAAGTGVADARVADAATKDAPVDASAAADAPLPNDGGRVTYHAIGVATGEDHACALLDDHRVKCWGDNDWGQLGYGDARIRGGSQSDMGDALPTVDLGTGRTATTIAAGRYATCAILDDGSLKCWGLPLLNGTGTSNNVGDELGEMGDNLRPLDFGGRKVVNIAMGWELACASMDDDSIWCWGGGTGPGGSGAPWQRTGLAAKRVKMLSPMSADVIALYDDGTLSPLLLNGSTSIRFTSDHEIVAVAGGWGDSPCALFDDATTACMDGTSQTNGPTNVVAIGAETEASTCVVLRDGDVQCRSQGCAPPYQCSSDGEFTFGAAAEAITMGGASFACALLADGNVNCWSGSEPSRAALGSEFDVLATQPDGGVVFGPWHAVDLGTH